MHSLLLLSITLLLLNIHLSLAQPIPIPVPKCSNSSATISSYYLTNVPDDVYKTPDSKTTASLCWTEEGISVSEHAIDKYPISPYKTCNSHVWENSAALELFISRVAEPTDVPIHYYEIDVTPTGAVFATLIENAKKGTTPTCPDCTVGELTCKGSSTFTEFPDLFNSAEKTISGWRTNRFIPFVMFDQFIHNSQNKNRFFKLNLFRYDYPQGMDKDYQLSGANPTFSPSFHIPARFGLIELVEKK